MHEAVLREQKAENARKQERADYLDALVVKPEGTLVRVLRFLHLPDDLASLPFHEVESRVRTVSCVWIGVE